MCGLMQLYNLRGTDENKIQYNVKTNKKYIDEQPEKLT